MPARAGPGVEPRRVAQRVVRTLLLLQDRPRSAAELVDAVGEAGGDHAYGAQPIYALRRDLQCLREAGFAVRFDRASGTYRLDGSPITLRLGEAAVQTLGLLEQSFRPGVPHAAEVQRLVSRIVALLPSDERRLLGRAQPMHLDLAPVDVVPSSPELIATLERAISRGVRIHFRYRASGRTSTVDREVEPYVLTYRQGHLYLRGYSIEAEDDREYRVDRIEEGSLQMSPIRRPPGRRSPRRYRVSRALTDAGISERFPGQQVEPLPDGGAVVSADAMKGLKPVRRLPGQRA